MAKTCKYDIILYLCNVFFIVLDLRLIRLRVRRYSFFLLKIIKITTHTLLVGSMNTAFQQQLSVPTTPKPIRSHTILKALLYHSPYRHE